MSVKNPSRLACAIAAWLLGADWALAGSVDVVYVDGFENGCGNLVYTEPFALADGSAWPAPWAPLGNVAQADVRQSMARLMPAPTGYSLARMGAAIDTRNVELRFTLRFEDLATQGVGLYVRQDGGYLTLTMPHGQGYAVFVEAGFRGLPGVGVWKEVDGSEIQIDHSPPPAPALLADVDYRVRYQVQQADAAQTLSRAKLWPASGTEPAAWQVSALDNTPVLQNLSGGIAVDSWSSIQSPGTITAHTRVDAVELISLCAP